MDDVVNDVLLLLEDTHGDHPGQGCLTREFEYVSRRWLDVEDAAYHALHLLDGLVLDALPYERAIVERLRDALDALAG